MSDIGDMWREHKHARQEKRASNRQASVKILQDAGIDFIAHSDSHLLVNDYDFWPGTGLFIHRKTKKRGRGVRNLIKLLNS